MSLTQLSIRYPAALLAMLVLLLVLGALGIAALPIQMLPDIEQPQITVATDWRSAAPQEVESAIVEPQEDVLRDLPGVIDMESNVRPGAGRVTLTFDLDIDLQQAFIDVINALNQAPDLPTDADEPEIRVGGGRFPAATLLLYTSEPTDDRDVSRFQRILETEVRPRLKTISGVSNVALITERDPMMVISFDPYRTAAAGVTINDIAQTVNRAVDQSGGFASVGRRRYTVRFLGGYDLSSMDELIVAWRGNQPIYLRDVAETEVELAPRTMFYVRSGHPAYYMRVDGQFGANTVSILDGVNEAIRELNAGPLAEAGLTLELSFDAAIHIRRALAMVNTNLGLGVLLALGVLWLFLRRARATLIIALTIPFSLLTAFMTLSFFERSLNVVSLAGLAFAVGLVLDSAIIVQENIVRLRQAGLSGMDAVQKGTHQVTGALFASTVTSIAIFLPILFVQGIEGQLFADLAMTLSVTVGASMLAALTILPTASGYLLKDLEHKDHLDGYWDRITAGVARWTGTPRRRAGWIAGLLGVPPLIAWLLMPRLDFLPSADADGVEVFFAMPAGIPMGTLEREIGDEVVRRLQPYLDGEQEPAIHGYNLWGNTSSQSGVYIYPSDPRRGEELIQLLREEILAGLPGTEVFAARDSLLNFGVSGGRNINIDLQGPDIEPLMAAAAAGREVIAERFPDWNVRALPGLSLAEPELRLTPDDLRIAQAGLDRATVANAIRTHTGGLFVGEFFDGNERMDVILWGGGWDTPEELAALPISTPRSGIQVIGQLATLERAVGPTQLRRVNGQRTVTLQVLPSRNMTVDEALELLRAEIGPTIRDALPDNAEIFYRGTADRLANAVDEMGQNFLLALLVLFLIMAAMFRSVRDSLVVLLVMPLAIVGGVVALRILNLFTYQSLDLLTTIGFIILLGLVVNNAILLVHQTRSAEREGLPRHQAVIQAIRVRTRPIFMSTLTSIFGMLPLMLIPGVGTEIYRGLAAVIVGGMSVSAVFTLLLLPSILRMGEGESVASPEMNVYETRLTS